MSSIEIELTKEQLIEKIALLKVQLAAKNTEYDKARGHYSIFRERPADERLKLEQLRDEQWDLEGQLATLNRKLTANPELEAKFTASFEEASAEIKKYLDQAREALSNAVRISKETGIPFRSSVVFNRDTYVPNTMQDKWEGLSDEFISEFSEENDFHLDSLGGDGWVTSYC